MPLGTTKSQLDHAQRPETWPREEAQREHVEATLHAPRVRPNDDEPQEISGSPRALHEASDFA